MEEGAKEIRFREDYHVKYRRMFGKQRPPLPQIVEAYRDYAPPCNAVRDVEMLLRHIPPEYLNGLQSIVLSNSLGLSRDERRQKIWSRNRKVQLSECRGWYSQSTPARGARITLLVDNIFRGAGRFGLRIGLFRNVVLADVLYHEVGHHIHATRRPEYRGKEDIAETWRAKLEKRLFRERYWYLLPIALPIKLAMDLKGDVLRLVRYVKRRIPPKKH
jgi:hypothetical protein